MAVMTMPEYYFDCAQGSPEWHALRAGIPTASEFKVVLREGADSKTRRAYILKLSGEILTGTPMDNYSNGHMERGKAMEAEARDLYAFYHDIEPDQIGFIKKGRAGCSPDSLIGNNGLLEIKSALPHIHLDILLRQEFPPQFKAQCQGALWISEREWIDLAVYWPGLPLFVKRAFRDDRYIADLADAVVAFNDELDKIVEQVRAYGTVQPTLKDVLRDSLAMLSEEPA
jgi:hypothetical protein